MKYCTLNIFSPGERKATAAWTVPAPSIEMCYNNAMESGDGYREDFSGRITALLILVYKILLTQWNIYEIINHCIGLIGKNENKLKSDVWSDWPHSLLENSVYVFCVNSVWMTPMNSTELGNASDRFLPAITKYSSSKSSLKSAKIYQVIVSWGSLN